MVVAGWSCYPAFRGRNGHAVAQGPRQSFANLYDDILRMFVTRLLNDQPSMIYEDG